MNQELMEMLGQMALERAKGALKEYASTFHSRTEEERALAEEKLKIVQELIDKIEDYLQ